MFRSKAYRLFLELVRSHLRAVVTHHDDSWRTKAALASATHGYALLSRMGLLDITNTLYRDNVFPIDADERCKACVDRGMVDFLGGRVLLRNNLFMLSTFIDD